MKKKFKFLNNYNIFKWELKIFDICIMVIICIFGFGVINVEMFICWWF